LISPTATRTTSTWSCCGRGGQVGSGGRLPIARAAGRPGTPRRRRTHSKYSGLPLRTTTRGRHAPDDRTDGSSDLDRRCCVADGSRWRRHGDGHVANTVPLRRLRATAHGSRLPLHGPRSARTMNSERVSVLEGNSFVVSHRNGDVRAGPGEPDELFHRDTRHLSRWLPTIDEQPLDALSTDDTKSFSARFFLISADIPTSHGCPAARAAA
jgi:hypothetical protein